MNIYDMKEECGIFGIYGHPEAANMAYLGLYALQHRGQEGAGICSSDGRNLHLEKSLGYVSEIFNEKRLRRLLGESAIGHNRYSTAGGNAQKNVQPIMVNSSLGSLSIAHNGNLTNAGVLKETLERDGAIFQSNADSEVIVHLIAHSTARTAEEKVIEAVNQIHGAFSLLILKEDELIAVRDSFGVRPMCIGTLDGAYVVASETCAFDLIGATYIRDVEPGEMVVINKNGINSIRAIRSAMRAHCAFEFIYFSRPDSYIFGGTNVHRIRKALGRQLAIESYVDADVVIPVPDSGVAATIGYANQSIIPFDFGLVRNHYIGRTFIEPKQNIRHFGVKIKLNPVQSILRGKRVVVVDDSIVRGTTSKKIVKMLREVGKAAEIHVRISSPCTISPCFYGIDTPTRNELIASTHQVEEIRKYLTADSLSYLSFDGLNSVLPNPDDYCYACFNSKYPISFIREEPAQMELFLA
ncbi:amidophosphoribosyltransferase [Candidatus Magnetominusculus xianensis]|uniref:Amidophosphoribosyltransferase n=1 Tax=Candidatus Magnetominusculus xianensis TaxID=1748249 RepID=A0ABR5SCM3_9BACT|nr:amidophosphoribosyltransferase [Candidatus Magnetominusculus xianensis]KWT81205.1 amidophosphoribosyltransferase [Candidatus Magnetominusculus xianensis]MBF0404281.1 amidophosphoribosyltransferase [Nitrospirota bacterium]